MAAQRAPQHRLLTSRIAVRIVVISNDVTLGFGVPVAAPGLRASGLAEGLAAHGHSVITLVPEDLLLQLFGTALPEPPAHTRIVAPSKFMAAIEDVGAEVVVFINSNLTPHLRPVSGVHFVYDLFAPKMLERQASNGVDPAALAQLEAVKHRAMALADSMWVNGARKVDYGLGWLARPDVDQIRTREFALPSRRSLNLAKLVTVVEMPVPLPPGISPKSPNHQKVTADSVARLGIAGYAQRWSSLQEVHHGHQLLVDSGHDLHSLLPGHWGGNPDTIPHTSLPVGVTLSEGPLLFDEFASWVQSMDAMVDVFNPSDERRFAMITRSAVALRLGVPLIHAVDSEISDIVVEHNAGWVLDPDDVEAWRVVAREIADPEQRVLKSAGAVDASINRFAPASALARAAAAIGALAR